MAKKRKSEVTRLDEIDRTMYSAFRGAANSLSQLYTHAMNHQRLSFLAGERRALEKLYQWIMRQQEEGSRASTVDVIAYLQNELEYDLDEAPMSPSLEFHQQPYQTAPPNVNNSTAPVSSSHVGAHYDCNQSKGSLFSSGLSSPIRRTLQQFHLAEASNHHLNSLSPGNSVDIFADTPGQDISR